MENNKGNKIADNREYYEDEIDLFELIHLLLKNKKLIALITAITTVAVFVVSAFIIKPVYQDSIEFRISEYPVIGTKYGEYSSLYKTNEDIAKLVKFTDTSDNNRLLSSLMSKAREAKIDITVEELADALVLSQDRNTPKIFSIGIKDTNIDLIEKSKEVVANEYMEYLDYRIEREYLDYFKSAIASELRSAQLDIELKTKLLQNSVRLSEQTPKFVENTNEVNPNWIKTEGYIMELRKEVEDLNVTVEMGTEKLLMIKKEQEHLTYPRTDSSFKSNLINLEEETLKVKKAKVNGKTLNGPEKVSPNVVMNTAVGFVLGLMIAVFYVFAKEWWKNNQKDIKARWNQYK